MSKFFDMMAFSSGVERHCQVWRAAACRVVRGVGDLRWGGIGAHTSDLQADPPPYYSYTAAGSF